MNGISGRRMPPPTARAIARAFCRGSDGSTKLPVAVWSQAALNFCEELGFMRRLRTRQNIVAVVVKAVGESYESSTSLSIVKSVKNVVSFSLYRSVNLFSV
ncbi:hypothetical protein GH714_018251 [Hevea brasiliensis]|uniref:Uncharacterized protein n=1 Tax=Hevea brasiliensis TaxID=3981 RepID=A0A6A6MXS5_HEVBR|nr:hypothetical protein GH714_018251 [Hevea brasiliensis]